MARPRKAPSERQPSGPKPRDGVRNARRVLIMIDDESDALAKHYGDGDRSAGIRIALKRLARIDAVGTG